MIPSERLMYDIKCSEIYKDVYENDRELHATFFLMMDHFDSLKDNPDFVKFLFENLINSRRVLAIVSASHHLKNYANDSAYLGVSS